MRLWEFFMSGFDRLHHWPLIIAALVMTVVFVALLAIVERVR